MDPRFAAAWAVSSSPVPYDEALATMETRVNLIQRREAPELIWLLEHPPCYTAGTSARPQDLLDASRFPVFQAGRGGQFTYHGPGQRVIYILLDVRRRFQGDVHAFVAAVESWLTTALAHFGVSGETWKGRTGVWVPLPSPLPGRSAYGKIAAIGLRLRRGISFHGASLNVAPDLSHFSGIVPCGLRDADPISLASLGLPVSMEEVDAALRAAFEDSLGPLLPAPPPLTLPGSLPAKQAATTPPRSR